MREKICIYILLIIFVALIGRLYINERKYEDKSIINTKFYETTIIEDATKMDSYNSDSTVYDDFINQLNQVEENIIDSSISDELNLSNASEAEKKPEYTALYPDLYVDENSENDLFEQIVSNDLEKIVNKTESNNLTKKVAYLTFDDGPSKVTYEVLKVLKEYDIKATFFVVGVSITPEREEIIKAISEQGHTIGIHTYSHVYKEIYQSVEAYLEDFYKAYEKIYELTEVKPTIFRFPGGSKNAFTKRLGVELTSEMERRGFQYYDWNVSAEDSVGNPSAYSIRNNILKNAKRFNEPVILMHDSSINKLTAQVLPDIIEEIRELGYGFDTLENRELCQFRQ